MSLTVAPQTYSLTVVPGGVVLVSNGNYPNAPQLNGDNTFGGINLFIADADARAAAVVQVLGSEGALGAQVFGVGNVGDGILCAVSDAGDLTAQTVTAGALFGNGGGLTNIAPANVAAGVFAASQVFTGPLKVRHSGGVAGTDEYVIDHDGSAVKLRNADTGGFLFRNAADSLTTLSIDNTGRVQTGQAYLDPWGGTNGGWLNFGTGGPAGIGTGGVGADLWIGRAASSNQFLNGAVAGDVCYRNTAGRLLFGSTSGNWSAALKNDSLILWRTSAPADADLAAGQFALWLDATNGAAKLMVKAKQADGTIRTASIALA